MKLNLKALLRNTKVLYVVFGIALLNFFTYIMNNQFDAVVAFLIFGFITRYLFSKNMIVILLSAMFITNTMMGFNYFKGAVIEGLENAKKDEKKGTKPKGKKVPAKKEPVKEKFESRLSGSKYNNEDSDDYDEAVHDIMDDSKKMPKIDYASTLESAYDNLDNLLGSDAIRSMTEDTQRLAEKQKQLMGNIQKLEPMMNKAGDMLKGLDIGKMGDMLKGLEGKMGMLGGLGASSFEPNDEE
jgi:hypothetical protein